MSTCTAVRPGRGTLSRENPARWCRAIVAGSPLLAHAPRRGAVAMCRVLGALAVADAAGLARGLAALAKVATRDRSRTGGLALLWRFLLALAGLGALAPAASAQIFTYTGAEQSYVVPRGVSEVHVRLRVGLVCPPRDLAVRAGEDEDVEEIRSGALDAPPAPRWMPRRCAVAASHWRIGPCSRSSARSQMAGLRM